MNTRRVSSGILAVALVCSIGCGSSFHKVEGTVTLDGKPVEGATVTFNPTFEGGQAASGITDSNGKFKVINPTNDKGIVKGEYKVVITKSKDDDKIPTDLSDPTTAMEAFWKEHKGKGKKAGSGVMPSTSLNGRYSKVDTTPFTINIPTDGAITLQLQK